MRAIVGARNGIEPTLTLYRIVERGRALEPCRARNAAGVAQLAVLSNGTLGRRSWVGTLKARGTERAVLLVYPSVECT